MSETTDVVIQQTVVVETVVPSLVEVVGSETVTVTQESISLVSEATQGPPGPPGPRGEPGGQMVQRTAATAISGHRVVMVNPGGTVGYASSAVLANAQRLIGITTHAAEAGAQVDIQVYGEVQEPSWSWDLNKPVYLGLDGALTQVTPSLPSSKFTVVVGFPIASDTLFVNIGLAITLT